MSYQELARQVAQQLGRDNAIKQRIVQRNPWAFSAMDAQELGEASGRELAARELKELGIDQKDNDPVDLLDAHHAGRAYERSRGDRRTGLAIKPSVMEGSSANDAAESFIDRYINGSDK
ncbi:MAG TPA: hypothetical protein VHX52_14430 [Steroidobacteraceae bacterium]|jgi:hypothetical protein|nr:hypothetical protein [Steroidobacteraceae bacterium]